MAKTLLDIQTVGQLIECQIDFQKRLGNKLPQSINNVSFENVQTSLSHNIYQNIEFQEFMEASIEDRKEELIDYLLFMINKYVYLGADVEKLNDYAVLGMLYSGHKDASFCQCQSLAQMEQNNYMTLIRKYTIFKPWKVRADESCTESSQVFSTFLDALSLFEQMANIVFRSYREFKETLLRKLDVNIERQNSGY